MFVNVLMIVMGVSSNMLLVSCLKDGTFWDEVRHYRSMNTQVNEFCADRHRETFVIPESVWNAEFHVTAEFCQQLVGLELLDQLQAFYESQPPTDIPEKKPSRYTC